MTAANMIPEVTVTFTLPVSRLVDLHKFCEATGAKLTAPIVEASKPKTKAKAKAKIDDIEAVEVTP